MDDRGFFQPVPLFEYMAQAMRKQHRRPKKGAPVKEDSTSKAFTVISEKDKLFFRVLPSPTSASSDQAEGLMTAVTDAFRGAFIEVWTAIPTLDRKRLTAHWRDQQRESFYGDPWPQHSHPPLIQIVDDDPWSADYQMCTDFGTTLTFPMSLVVEHPKQLTLEIACVLAHVFAIATGTHWRRVQAIIEEPLRRWEKRQGKKLTDDARDRKFDKLEASFIKGYEAERAKLFDRWGLQPAPSTKRRTTKERGQNKG